MIDGDTIKVLHKKTPQRIRLYGIDRPKTRQTFCNRVKQAMSALVFAKTVTIKTHGQDKYQRTVGEVILSNGTNVNREVVAEDWRWWYQKYAPEDVILAGLDAAARVTKKGFWANPAPVPPWEWRKLRKK